MAFEETILSYGNEVKVTLMIADVETTIGAVDSWSVGEDTRQVIDVPRTFEDGRLSSIVSEKNPQDITISGFYLADGDDAGWKALRDYYDDAESDAGKIAEDIMKLYVDDGTRSGSTQHITASAGSYFKVTALSSTDATREGWTSFGCTLRIFGEIKQVPAS